MPRPSQPRPPVRPFVRPMNYQEMYNQYQWRSGIVTTSDTVYTNTPNWITINGEESMNHTQLMRQALAHLLKYGETPDWCEEPYNGERPLSLYLAKNGDIAISNNHYGGITAIIDLKHMRVNTRRGSIYRDTLEAFARRHHLKLVATPNYDGRTLRNMGKVTRVDKLKEVVMP